MGMLLGAVLLVLVAVAFAAAAVSFGNKTVTTGGEPPSQSVPPAGPVGTSQASVAAVAGSWLEDGIVLVSEGQDWDAASYAGVEDVLSRLPASVRASLGNRSNGPLHILVNIAGRTMSGWQPYGGPANYFSTLEGTNEIVLFPKQSPKTIAHELGHAYNLRNVSNGRQAMVLLDPQMQSFMVAASWTVLTPGDQVRNLVDHFDASVVLTTAPVWASLSHNNPLEDFAESFALFYMDPEGLAKLSPARYEWFVANLARY
jgi:hypothetical protein